MTSWNDFLEARLAAVAAHGRHYAPVAGTTYLTDLSHLGLLAVEGPDAAKFLQGQVTCDVRELAGPVTRLGAQCTPKGRMIVSFRALQREPERIFLSMDRGLIDTALGSFGKYIVFSKAKLHDRSSSFRRVGIYGPEAENLLRSVFPQIPALNDEWCDNNGTIIVRLAPQRFECWLLPEQAEAIWLDLERGCVLGDSGLWTLLTIRAGEGEVLPLTSEQFTPQALNYQLVNGISFRKGCYTGQEIVARLHYRGTLKQHMYRVGFHLDPDAPLPAPGSAVLNSPTPGDGQHRTIGELVSVARCAPDAAEALAVLSDTQLAHAFIALVPPQKLEPLPLPYAIPMEDKS